MAIIWTTAELRSKTCEVAIATLVVTISATIGQHDRQTGRDQRPEDDRHHDQRDDDADRFALRDTFFGGGVEGLGHAGLTQGQHLEAGRRCAAVRGSSPGPAAAFWTRVRRVAGQSS